MTLYPRHVADTKAKARPARRLRPRRTSARSSSRTTTRTRTPSRRASRSRTSSSKLAGRRGDRRLRRHRRPGGEPRPREGPEAAGRAGLARRLRRVRPHRMVDTQPEQGNHSLPARHFPDVVIDHHPRAARLSPRADRRRGRPPRRDLDRARRVLPRERARDAGARSRPRSSTASRRTPATSGARPPSWTSTPTSGCSRWWTRTRSGRSSTRSCPTDYFRLYHAAIEKAQVYEDEVVICDLGEIYTPGHGRRGRRALHVPRGHALVARLRRVRGPALLLRSHGRPAHERGPPHPRGDRGEGRLGRAGTAPWRARGCR